MFPYPAGHENVLNGLATAFLIFNIILFLVFTAASIARYWMYPEIWTQMLLHPVQSLYLGCVPMALSTIINGLVLEAYQKCVRLALCLDLLQQDGTDPVDFSYRIAGDGFLYFIWALWWVNLGLAWLTNLGFFYIMYGPNFSKLTFDYSPLTATSSGSPVTSTTYPPLSQCGFCPLSRPSSCPPPDASSLVPWDL